ncbi:MAG TPA: hypothetical protein ENN80_01690, partial [Candidatus Hydrogenedentes bacterium]|nr:hypothetical protein [Candidatus Hydrogenedentota bacterium]
MKLLFSTLLLLSILYVLLVEPSHADDDAMDLAGATIVVRHGHRTEAEQTAAAVLLEEVQKRTGLE